MLIGFKRLLADKNSLNFTYQKEWFTFILSRFLLQFFSKTFTRKSLMYAVSLKSFYITLQFVWFPSEFLATHFA